RNNEDASAPSLLIYLESIYVNLQSLFHRDHPALLKRLKSNDAAMMRTAVGRSIGSVLLADSAGTKTAR
ncbi:MAG TPA: hypothetical protein VGG86_13845, partial [Roseiarcus sp.]